MNKICKFLTLIILIVVVLLFGIYQYRTFIQTEIYQENSEHLLATYEQVNRTFTLFTQRNWNVLSDWDEYLQCISDSGNTETVWHDFADGKTTGNTVISICLTNTVIFLQPTTGKALQTVSGTVFRKCTASNAPLFLTILPAAANIKSSLRFR